LDEIVWGVDVCISLVWRIALSGIRPTIGYLMPDYCRFRVPGGTYFFTVNLLERQRDTLVRYVDALREAV
jgi:hypothetical protein